MPEPKKPLTQTFVSFARVEDRLLVGVEHLLEAVEDVVGHDVLIELEGDDVLVGEIDLDDLLDRAPDGTSEDVLDLHSAPLSFVSRGMIVAR